MKEIKAIIQPFMASKVIEALKELEGLPGVTVSEVMGFGRSRSANAAEKVVDRSTEYGKKVKLEIVVPESLVEPVVEIITSRARTGRPGDGKIFLMAVDDAVRIRSGEEGETAL